MTICTCRYNCRKSRAVYLYRLKVTGEGVGIHKGGPHHFHSLAGGGGQITQPSIVEVEEHWRLGQLNRAVSHPVVLRTLTLSWTQK